MNGYENQPERRKPTEYLGTLGTSSKLDIGNIVIEIKSLLRDVELVMNGRFTPWSYEEIDVMVDEVHFDGAMNGLEVDNLRDVLRTQLKLHAWWIELTDMIEAAELSVEPPIKGANNELILDMPSVCPTAYVGIKSDKGEMVYAMGWDDTSDVKLANAIVLLTQYSSSVCLRGNLFSGGKKVVFIETVDENYLCCNDDFLILDSKVLEYLNHDNETLARQCASYIVDTAHEHLGISSAKSIPFRLSESVYSLDASVSMSLPVCTNVSLNIA
jgi:hypothetical protein